MRAAKYLLKGSKPVGQGQKLFDETVDEFRKSGGYQQAFADFRTIKPINIKEYDPPGRTATAGRIGDRVIIMHPKGYFEAAMIEIIK